MPTVNEELAHSSFSKIHEFSKPRSLNNAVISEKDPGNISIKSKSKEIRHVQEVEKVALNAAS